MSAILIVDDEADVCRSLGNLLKDEGHNVDSVLSAEDGIIMVKENKYDCIISDLWMLGKDGFEFFREIRAMGVKTPVIMMSGHATEEIKKKALEMGINNFVFKPFRIDSLFSILDKLLGKKEVPKDAAPVKRAIDAMPSKQKGTSRGRILVVDDNEVVRRTLSDVLDDNGYSVDTASDGDDAIAMIRANYYDVVLMDINMPRMNGVEAVKRIKAISPKIFVVMMTGEAQESVVQESIEYGGYVCLRKPFSYDTFIKSIEWFEKVGRDKREHIEQQEKLRDRTATEKLKDGLTSIASETKKKARYNMGFIALIIVVCVIISASIVFVVPATREYLNGNVIGKIKAYGDAVLGYLERDEKREMDR